jgi:hypothetical protein
MGSDATARRPTCLSRPFGNDENITSAVQTPWWASAPFWSLPHSYLRAKPGELLVDLRARERLLLLTLSGAVYHVHAAEDARRAVFSHVQDVLDVCRRGLPSHP